MKKPDTTELKQLYTQGIRSGEIDPLITSFNDFVDKTALSQAASEDTEIQVVISGGDNATNADLNEQMIFAAFQGDMPKVNTCLANGAFVNYKNQLFNDRTALVLAAEGGYFELCQMLIEAGAELKGALDCVHADRRMEPFYEYLLDKYIEQCRQTIYTS